MQPVNVLTICLCLAMSIKAQRPKPCGTYYTLVSEFGCLPLSDMYYDTHGLWITAFFNLISGIRDPSVFTPPSFCEKGSSLDVL
ncbi:ependymin [Amia ocellicauda]|uniref:ependymin n=1 Tax=Amia ocellicauda TaxID=2972642 RepID=UPI0034639D71